MNRRVFNLTGVFFLVAVAAGLAQEPQATPAPAMPAATVSEAECSGFIVQGLLPDDLYVLDGEDNEFHLRLRQFRPGNVVFLGGRSGQSVTVGTEYRLVRPADEPLFSLHQKVLLPLLGHTSWYAGQRASIRSLGHPYEDVGRVKVIGVAPEGGLAEVTFACSPVSPLDIAIPYEARAIPEYTPATSFDRFALPNGQLVGAITAAAHNAGAVGKGRMVYVNLGESDGARPGQRYRIFRIFREISEQGLRSFPDTPRESLGELVILSTQERSSVGMVVTSVRDVALGDGIELE